MFAITTATIRGIFRDRVFQGILAISLIFLAIPSIASLSMRQVTELSITLSLSLLSFILLILTLFIAGPSLWKDLERRYSHSILGMPLRRSDYILGKFGGIALFLIMVTTLLGAVAFVVIWFSSAIYPAAQPIVWGNIFLAIGYDVLKYILLMACAFLLSTVSTSFFLPIFGTVSLFLVGNASQEVYDFIHTASGQKLPALLRYLASGLYYILPNFSAFDLKLNAIYGLPLSPPGLLLTFVYFLVYTAIALYLATLVFSRRELS